MNYESPIHITYQKLTEDFGRKMENGIMEVVHSYDINVDKEELIKALKYDRDQYNKGYRDGGGELNVNQLKLDGVIEFANVLKGELKLIPPGHCSLMDVDCAISSAMRKTKERLIPDILKYSPHYYCRWEDEDDE